MKLKNNIFYFFFNNKLKKTHLNLKKSDLRKIKYFPAYSNEWKNIIYYFNNNNLKNVSIEYLNINKIIKFYFNLYFKDNSLFLINKLLEKKCFFFNKKKHFLRNIHISQTEIKHKNNKIIINLYILNLEKNILIKRFLITLNKYNKNIYNNIKSITNLKKKTYLYLYNIFNNNIIINKNVKKNFLKKFIYSYFILKKILFKKLIIIRKYQYIYLFNKYKFDNTYLLYKLSNIISNLSLFKAKLIEFNIINIKSFAYNADIFTNVLSLKLKKKRIKLLKGINSILNRAKFPKINSLVERANKIKYKDSNLMENKFKDTKLVSLLKDNLYLFLYNNLYNESKYINYNKEFYKIYYNIFNSIHYKNMGGIRLIVKGRLTKRYRADRAIMKLKWKGGLKNGRSVLGWVVGGGVKG
uniref:Ribosomal protein 3 n=1 Tax=Cornuvesica falcata TaxID=5155 RepID=D2E3Z9_9PEZI|nr:ribosomal protein 3 [Cornuvesica falcata]